MPGGAWRRERCQNTDPDLYKFIIKIFKQDKYMENDNTRVRGIKMQREGPSPSAWGVQKGWANCLLHSSWTGIRPSQIIFGTINLNSDYFRGDLKGLVSSGPVQDFLIRRKRT